MSKTDNITPVIIYQQTLPFTPVIECNERGSPRRCGGQGDLLSGSIGLFAHWTKDAQTELEYITLFHCQVY